MSTYSKIHFSQISEILMQAAMGVSAVNGCRYVVSDMMYSLCELGKIRYQNWDEPFYIAIREHGVESGNKEHCSERCKDLGYPLVIAKIEMDKVCDYDMKVVFTHKDIYHIEEEFDYV